MKSEKKVIILIILLVAVVISIGIIKNSRTNSSRTNSSATSNIITSASDRMQNQAIAMYNTLITPYLDNPIKGIEVKSLIQKIIDSNTQYADVDDKFISIEMEGEDSLTSACKIANPYDNGDNSIENVQEASNQMSNLESKINKNKTYNVSATYDDGLIVKVKISEN